MRRLLLMAGSLALAAMCSGCASRTPPTSPGGQAGRVLQTREGVASFYGTEFHGKRTASGIRFDMNAMVAAHPSYPFGTRLRVTNLSNQRSATVRVVDRGPSAEQQADGVVIDVSRRAAQQLGFVERGRTRVRLEVLSWGS
jgi:rare lipoprotein A